MRFALALLFALLVTLTGCPPGNGQQDFSTLPSLTTDDPEAEADLRRANDAADRGEGEEAERLYRAFLEMHPTDPLVPLAELGLGRLLLANGEVEPALEKFEAVAASSDPVVSEAGRFYQGVALQLAGRHAEAIERLHPLVGRTTDPDESNLLLRTLAAAAEAEHRTALALEALDRLAQHAEEDEAELANVREMIRGTIERAEPAAITQAYNELPREGVAWSEVAVRAIRLAFDSGDMPRVLEIVAVLREREYPMEEELAELAVRAERTERADPRVIGAIVPLTGAGREIGQRTVRGLMLAAGSPASGPPRPDAPQLVMRDDGGDPLRAAAAVEDLVSEHRAIAIIGPIEGAAARAAARRAQELGVPLLALVADPRVTRPGPMVFRLFPSPLEEASALVRAAHARGARRFALLRPDHAYGRAFSEAYSAAIEEVGGELVTIQTYEPGATAFGEVISALQGHSFDALFVPDTGRQLNLIAPALASADLWSTPAGQSAPRTGRAITLMAPSVALDPRLLRSSSRYLQGALFAAPFHSETAQGAGRAFVDAFVARFDTPPDAFAAYAYDAFVTVRGAVEAGRLTRGEVAGWLSRHGARATVGSSGGLSSDRTPAAAPRVLEMRGEAFSPVSVPES